MTLDLAYCESDNKAYVEPNSRRHMVSIEISPVALNKSSPVVDESVERVPPSYCVNTLEVQSTASDAGIVVSGENVTDSEKKPAWQYAAAAVDSATGYLLKNKQDIQAMWIIVMMVVRLLADLIIMRINSNPERG